MTDLSLDLIEKYCQRYLDSYIKCVDEFPHTWKLDCKKQRSKLAKCGNTSPAISYIRLKCAKQFEVYEKCTSENPNNEVDMCAKYFNEFNKCADETIKKEGVT